MSNHSYKMFFISKSHILIEKYMKTIGDRDLFLCPKKGANMLSK